MSQPATMLAACATSANTLSLLHAPIPTPPPGWVLVKLQASTINRHDLFTLAGIGATPVIFPVTLGLDGTGLLPDGAPVVVYPFLVSPSSIAPTDSTTKIDETIDPTRYALTEQGMDGTLAEYVVVPARNAVPRPSNMSAQTAATLGTAWLTAWRMLRSRAVPYLPAGGRVLVCGSSGGVASALVQLGVALGYEVWSVARTAAGHALATELGAARVFGSAEEIEAGSVNAVMELSGAATFSGSLAAVKAGGVVVVCGIHTGMEVKVDLMKVVVEQVTVTGCYGGTLEEFGQLVEWVGKKGMVPKIGNVVALENVKEGMKLLEEGGVAGKVVVEIGRRE